MSSDPWIGSLLLQLFLILAIGWCVRGKAAVDAILPSILHRDEDEECDKRLLYVAEKSEQLLSSVTLLAVLCITCAGALSTVDFAPRYMALFTSAGGNPSSSVLQTLAVVVNGFVLGLLTILFAVVLPRASALRHPERTVLKSFFLMKAISLLLLPLTSLINACARGILIIFNVSPKESPEQVTEEEIRSMVDIGSEHGTIEETEKEMIENIFEFNNHTAEDVMTHRTNVDCIWLQDDRATVMNTILETGRSRFPVYDSDMDDIVGILNTRDFLLESHAASPRPLKDLLREAYFVPETVQADALFRNMQKNKIQMSIVVDEYGGMAGIVTMEDLLEEIVGNIYDETDKQTPAEICPVGDNLWRISGSASLEDIADELEVKLPLDEEYDTLSGLVFDQFTTIPDDGTSPVVDAFGLHIQVEKIFEHHVEFALVSKLTPQNEPQEDSRSNQ